MQSVKDFVIGFVCVMVLSILISGGFIIGYSANNKAGMADSTESVEIKKNQIIEEIVQEQQDVNLFQQYSKIAELSNLSLDKLQSLKDQGITIYIVESIDSDDNTETLAEINSKAKSITISLKAEKGTIVDAVNTFL